MSCIDPEKLNHSGLWLGLESYLCGSKLAVLLTMSIKYYLKSLSFSFLHSKILIIFYYRFQGLSEIAISKVLIKYLLSTNPINVL
jgi:hypothetical protein